MNDMECKLTQRGFEYYEFIDRYGEKCSLQKSSLATEDAIWMGVDDLGLKGMRYGQGWTPIAEEEVADVFGYQMVQGNKRMHLTREQVAQLLPILQRFVDTGEIGESEVEYGLIDDLEHALLSDEVVEAAGYRLSRGAMFPDEYLKDAEYKRGTDALAKGVLQAALAAIKGTEGSE